MPEVNEDLKVEPTIRIPIKEDITNNNEELELIDRFSPVKEGG